MNRQVLEFKWLKLLYSNNSLETFLEINKITISPRDPRQILPVWSDTEDNEKDRSGNDNDVRLLIEKTRIPIP